MSVVLILMSWLLLFWCYFVVPTKKKTSKYTMNVTVTASASSLKLSFLCLCVFFVYFIFLFFFTVTLETDSNNMYKGFIQTTTEKILNRKKAHNWHSYLFSLNYTLFKINSIVPCVFFIRILFNVSLNFFYIGILFFYFFI